MGSRTRLCLIGVFALSGCGSADVSLAPGVSEAPAHAMIAASSAPPSAAGRSVMTGRGIRRARNGLFYVEALVNGTPIRFVVDSGSSIVVLSRTDADRAGVAVGAGDSLLQTAGGVTAMRPAVVARMTVAEHRLRDVEAAVVDGGIDVSLLGQSALSRLEAVNFSGDRLDLR